jgi:hypothetical protein
LCDGPHSAICLYYAIDCMVPFDISMNVREKKLITIYLEKGVNY